MPTHALSVTVQSSPAWILNELREENTQTKIRRHWVRHKTPSAEINLSFILRSIQDTTGIGVYGRKDTRERKLTTIRIIRQGNTHHRTNQERLEESFHATAIKFGDTEDHTL